MCPDPSLFAVFERFMEHDRGDEQRHPDAGADDGQHGVQFLAA